MNSFLLWILSFIVLYKYAAIFIILMFGGLLTPYPAGAVITGSAFLATGGYLNLNLVILTSFIGSVVGDVIGYWFTIFFGERILGFLGLRRAMRDARVRSVFAHFASRPLMTIFLSRFAFTQVVNIFAGLAKVSFKKFFFVSAFGELLDVLVLIALGVFFGDNVNLIFNILGVFGTVVAIFLVGFILLGIKKSRQHRDGSKSLLP